eukprot:scaffold4726_cov128-Cylindrotheca_fusiformis.AAC.5
MRAAGLLGALYQKTAAFMHSAILPQNQQEFEAKLMMMNSRRAGRTNLWVDSVIWRMMNRIRRTT